MARHKDTEAALDEIREKFDASMEEGRTISVNMSVKPRKRSYELVTPFAILFFESFMRIVKEYNLTRMEILAVGQMLNYMKFGNLVKMSFSKLMGDIGSDPTNGSRVMKRLKEAKLLIEDDGNIYFNPQVIAKGLKEEDLRPEVVEHGAEMLEELGIEPNILTKNLKRKQKAKAKAKKTT